MKRVCNCLVGLVAAALMGCGTNVTFTGESTVHVDGALTRVSRFDLGVETAEAYTLPQPGAWMPYVHMSRQYRSWPSNEERISDSSRERSAWIAANHYARRLDIPPDFVRLAPGTEERAENRIRVRKESWWFVSLFHYEESFRDIVTLEGIISFLELLRNDSLAHLRAGIPEDVVAFVTQADVESAFERAIVTEIDAEIAALRENGLAYVYDWIAALDETEEDFQDVRLARFADELLDGQVPSHPEFLDRDDWHDFLWRRLATPIGAQFGERFESGEISVESIFGAHGFELFDSYNFLIRLEMPGRIYDTNGIQDSYGSLSWDFRYEEFVWKTHTLHASSRIVHWGRIATVLIVLTIVLGWLFSEFAKRGPSRFDV